MKWGTETKRSLNNRVRLTGLCKHKLLFLIWVLSHHGLLVDPNKSTRFLLLLVSYSTAWTQRLLNSRVVIPGSRRFGCWHFAAGSCMCVGVSVLRCRSIAARTIRSLQGKKKKGKKERKKNCAGGLFLSDDGTGSSSSVQMRSHGMGCWAVADTE